MPGTQDGRASTSTASAGSGSRSATTASFPEIFRSLAWQGAEAIFQVRLTGTSDRDAETVVARANANVNQVAVVNVNAAAPVGNGRSLVIDAEGAVRYEAGVAEEVVTAVLDLDAVARVRERGQLRHQPAVGADGPRRAGLDLPMYGGRYRPRPRAAE